MGQQQNKKVKIIKMLKKYMIILEQIQNYQKHFNNYDKSL